MFRRSVLVAAAVAVLALPGTAAAGGLPEGDPLAGVKECKESLSASVSALLWGEWQSYECF